MRRKHVNKFIKFYNSRKAGFLLKENIPSDCWEDFVKLCVTNDSRLGYYIYHSHAMIDGELQFDEMKVGYYVRKPFGWRRHKVYYN